MREYLLSEYKRTGWHTFSVTALKIKGVFNKDEANSMAKEKPPLISKGEGMNSELVILNREHPECLEIRGFW